MVIGRRMPGLRGRMRRAVRSRVLQAFLLAKLALEVFDFLDAAVLPRFPARRLLQADLVRYIASDA